MHLLLALGLFASPCFAATVDDVLATAERMKSAPDEVLTRHLRTLEKSLGVTLPIDPAAARKGEPKAGVAMWGNSSFSDLGAAQPHLLAGTLVLPRSKTDPSVSTAKTFETTKTPLAAAPACRAVLASGSKAGDVSVGVSSVPWRAQRGPLPADLESTRVLDVYDGAVALERGGAVSLVKAAVAPADAPALRQPELLELGEEFELHGIGFSQPGQLEPTRVKVASSAPIVLVLASGEAAQWQVDVQPNATLRAVVLLGGGGQQVRFGKASAPVVLAVDEWPCGASFGPRWDPLSGRAEEPAVIAKVLALLGRRPPLAFTAAQGGLPTKTGSMGEAEYVVGSP